MEKLLASSRGYPNVAGALQTKSKDVTARLFAVKGEQTAQLLIIDARGLEPNGELVRVKCMFWWKRVANTACHVILWTKDGAGCPVHRQRLDSLIHKSLPSNRQFATVQVEHVDNAFMDAFDKPAECTTEQNAARWTETESRWRVRTALIRLIYDRGYELVEADDVKQCITWEQFEALGNDRKERDHLHLIGVKGKTNMMTMFRQSDFSRDFGKIVGDFVKDMKVPFVVLVTGGEKPLAKNIAAELRLLQPDFFIHSMTSAELEIADGVLHNELVPRHKVATKEEIDQLRNQYRLGSLSLLPSLQDTDFLARYYGLVAGQDVVKIERHSATAGSVTYWRSVIDSQSLEGTGAHTGKPVAAGKRRPWKLEGEESKEPKAENKKEVKGDDRVESVAPVMPVGWMPPGFGLGGGPMDFEHIGEEL